MEKTIRQRIMLMKAIKNEHKLTVNQILDLVAQNGGYVSEKTAQKVFKEGSENTTFHYHSIADIYEALTKTYGDDIETTDATALKHIISERDKKIDALLIQIEDLQEDFTRRLTFYKERKEQYEKTIALLDDQLHKKDELIERLMTAYLPDKG